MTKERWGESMMMMDSKEKEQRVHNSNNNSVQGQGAHGRYIKGALGDIAEVAAGRNIIGKPWPMHKACRMGWTATMEEEEQGAWEKIFSSLLSDIPCRTALFLGTCALSPSRMRILTLS